MNSLPIDVLLPELCQALALRDEAVLEAPPGAGKTTRVPLALLTQPWLAGQTIIMLEPRRLAARAAAERLASELGEAVGETVGYRIRLDSKVGPRTRIEVVTEGILTRRLQDDPALEGVGLLIFDEFHERSLDADLALALSLNGRELFRDDQPLKILLMSATLEGERLAGLLDDAPILRSEGRMYPVAMRWGRPFQAGEFIEPRLVQTILEALNDETGSVLVFLPGQAEIRRVHQQLADVLGDRSDVLLCPGGLAAYAQVMPQGGLWYGYFGSHQRDWRASSLLLPRAQIQWADPRFLDDQGHLYPQPRLLTSPHENAWSGNFALQRRDYYALQGFDEDFVGWGGEDLDFAWRACQAGYPIHFTLEAWGEHQPHPLSEPFHLLPRGKIYPFPTHRAPAQAVRCVCSPLAAQAWEQRLYYYQQDLIRDNFGL